MFQGFYRKHLSELFNSKEFSKRGFAKTYPVFWTTLDQKEQALVGYYSIAPKTFTISKELISFNY